VAFGADSSCAGDQTADERIANVPHWTGGLPDNAPLRRGSREYGELTARRAQEAARPNIDQPE